MNLDERRGNTRIRELIDDLKTRVTLLEAYMIDTKKYHKLLIVTICVIAAGKSILEAIKL